MENLQVKNQLTFDGNRFASVLGHGCAVPDELAAKLPNLRTLQLAWKLQAAIYNGSLKSDGKGMPCPEGWGEIFEPEYINREDRVLTALVHQTHSGRLYVKITERQIELEFYAGPDKPDMPGRFICRLTIRPTQEYPYFMDVTSGVRRDLIEGRPDRLELLWKFDQEIFGGKIFYDLEHAVGTGQAEMFFPGKVILFEAKHAWDTYVREELAKYANMKPMVLDLSGNLDELTVDIDDK